MSNVTRNCPYDGKKLRSDNTKGICSKCQARGRTLEGAPPTPSDRSIYDVKAPSERTAPKKAKIDALKRFRVVAAALDEDPDALLEAFAESWLAQLKERTGN